MFEIREARTLELIECAFTFEDAAELLRFYQDICGYDVVMIRSDLYKHTSYKTTEKQQYKHAYINYFAELQEMGNLL